MGGATIAYTYDVATANTNGLTLQSLSTNANVEMRVNESGEFYPDFQKFYDYYGTADYANQIIQAAFAKTAVTLNGRVFDFSGYDFPARGGMFSA